MLRLSIVRSVSAGACACVLASTVLAGTAIAQGASGSGFIVELSLDRLMVELSDGAPGPAPAAPVLQGLDAPGDAPFANQPPYALGAPRLGPTSAFVFDEDAFAERCASRCSDLAASFAVRAEGDEVNLSFGATAGVADRISGLSSSSSERSNWYLFVAADAQAMSWSFAGRQAETSSGVKLDDMRLLGDVQAGLGARVAGGDLAMGFVSREVSHMGASRQENFVGLTFGWDGT